MAKTPPRGAHGFQKVHQRSDLKHLSRGFTLVELLVVIALLGIIASLAAPDLRGAIVRSKVAGLGNEFAMALQQARALAVSRNSCMTFCVASANNATTCAALNAATANFVANGWLIFDNPACDSTATDPASASVGGTVLQQRSGEASGYSLMRPNNPKNNMVLFDPRGNPIVGSGTFLIQPPSSVSTLNGQDYRRLVCIDVTGRPTVRQYAASCS